MSVDKRILGAMGITEADWNALPKAVQDGATRMYGENEALTKAVSGGDFTLHVGQKGGIAIRGFGQFPHNFYVDQWTRFEKYLKGGGFDTIAKFIQVNQAKLKSKATAVVDNKAAAPAV